MAEVVAASGLFKAYGEGPQAVEVLKGLDFSVAAGEYLVILGPSGCGKSTLLNILGLMDRPDAGELRVRGQSVGPMDEAARSRLRGDSIGFVFQFDSLLPEFTVLENVTMPERIALARDPSGRRGLEAASGRALGLLEGLGLKGVSERFPRELSGGERQRVAICRALLRKPALLLADEPTGNLDRNNGDRVFRDLRDLAEQEGTAVVVVTHNEAAGRDAGRVLRMLDGAMVK